MTTAAEQLTALGHQTVYRVCEDGTVCVTVREGSVVATATAASAEEASGLVLPVAEATLPPPSTAPAPAPVPSDVTVIDPATGDSLITGGGTAG